MNRFSVLLIWVVLFFFGGCEEEELFIKPENLIPEETYIFLMVELQLMDALVYTSDDSTYTDSLYDALLEHYKISEDQFVASNKYYQHNVDNHIERIDSALKAIEREQKLLNQSEDDGSD
tara:strand:+ start:47958 stop:48317 length:360 start_codon:yes stop_codon:yes gene_type:complete